MRAAGAISGAVCRCSPAVGESLPEKFPSGVRSAPNSKLQIAQGHVSLIRLSIVRFSNHWVVKLPGVRLKALEPSVGAGACPQSAARRRDLDLILDVLITSVAAWHNLQHSDHQMKKRFRVAVIVGTRPEAIKLAPVVQFLSSSKSLVSKEAAPKGDACPEPIDH